MKTLLPFLATLAIATGAGAAEHETLPAAGAAAANDSIYLLDAAFEDHDGREVKLGAFEGRPVLMTMFYGSCHSACPMLIADLQRIEKAIPDARRGELAVVLVSFDPARDTPAAMKALGEAHGVDLSRWRFLRADEGTVRDVAAVLGIKYRFAKDGAINHSSVITLLDRQGRIVHQLDGLRQPEGPIVEKLETLRPAARVAKEREAPKSCH